MSRVFSRLHPNLTAALEEKGWEPTPVQENVLPDVMEGHDRLVIAPVSYTHLTLPTTPYV